MSKIITPGHPDFYINRNRYAEGFSSVEVGVETFYVARRLRHGEVVQELPIKNLITDTGMNALGSGFGIDYLQLGTGTTPPNFTDASLGNYGGAIHSGGGSVSTIAPVVSGSSPYYIQSGRRYTSAVGGATGNWTELGVSNQLASGGLRSKALIVDNVGNPTVFTVQSDEQAQIDFFMRLYMPETDSPATVTISGTSYDTITRAIGVTQAAQYGGVGWWVDLLNATLAMGSSRSSTMAYTGDLGAITATSLTGPLPNSIPAVTTASYTAGSHLSEASFALGSGKGVGNIRTLHLNGNSTSFQVRLNPVLNKLTNWLFIHNQRISWARR